MMMISSQAQSGVSDAEEGGDKAMRVISEEESFMTPTKLVIPRDESRVMHETLLGKLHLSRKEKREGKSDKRRKLHIWPSRKFFCYDFLFVLELAE